MTDGKAAVKLDAGKVRMSLLSPNALLEVGKVAEFGSKKVR